MQLLFNICLLIVIAAKEEEEMKVPFYFSAGIHHLTVTNLPPPTKSIIQVHEAQPALDVTSTNSKRLASETINSYRDVFKFAETDDSSVNSVIAELTDDLAHTIESHKYSHRPLDRCSLPEASVVWDHLPVACLNVHTAMVYAGYVEGKKREGTRRGDSSKMLRTNLSSRLNFPSLLDDCGLNRVDAVVVEVGVLKGDFGRRLLEDPAGGFRGRYIGIDYWGPIDFYVGIEDKHAENKEIAISQTTAKHENAELWQMLSLTGATKLDDLGVDFLYLDATHLYETVLAELRAFWPKVKVGGIIAGDDYFNGFVFLAGYSFGVKDAVDQFAAEVKHRVYLTGPEEGPGGLPNWYMLKCCE